MFRIYFIMSRIANKIASRGIHTRGGGGGILLIEISFSILPMRAFFIWWRKQNIYYRLEVYLIKYYFESHRIYNWPIRRFYVRRLAEEACRAVDLMPLLNQIICPPGPSMALLKFKIVCSAPDEKTLMGA